jgi:GTP-binding protein
MRYLENSFREELELVGSPIQFQLKNSDNPYKGKQNKLSTRQYSRRQRLIKHRKTGR